MVGLAELDRFVGMRDRYSFVCIREHIFVCNDVIYDARGTVLRAVHESGLRWCLLRTEQAHARV